MNIKKEKMRERSSNSAHSLANWLYFLAAMALIALILLIGTIIIAGLTLGKANDTANNKCCGCFDIGRDRANDINNLITRSINTVITDADGSVDLFVSLFNADAFWEGAFFIVEGTTDIRALAQSYADAPGETDVVAVVHQTYWDGKLATLSVERNRTATTTADRDFFNITNSTISTYPSGTTYTQDESAIIRFNCNWEIVYYRVYVENYQVISTYDESYPTPCLSCTTPPTCLA